MYTLVCITCTRSTLLYTTPMHTPPPCMALRSCPWPGRAIHKVGKNARKQITLLLHIVLAEIDALGSGHAQHSTPTCAFICVLVIFNGRRRAAFFLVGADAVTLGGGGIAELAPRFSTLSGGDGGV